jgi:hypothetical protein
MGERELRRVRIRRSAPAVRSARAAAIRRRFDLAPRASRLAIDVEVPAAGGDWRIGVIVGASGSGKSQVLGGRPSQTASQAPRLYLACSVSATCDITKNISHAIWKLRSS